MTDLLHDLLQRVVRGQLDPMAIRGQHLIAALFEQLHRTSQLNVPQGYDCPYLLSRCFIIILGVDCLRSAVLNITCYLTDSQSMNLLCF